MPVIADAHVHIYPCYDINDVVRHAIRNLDALASDSQAATGSREGWDRALFLTERSDCHMFREYRENGLVLEQVDGVTRATNDDLALAVQVPGIGRLYLIAGRQIVTEERLEVAGLALDTDIPDGLPIREVIQRIDDANGVPVLPWSPGKWFVRRGRVVKELIEEMSPGRLVLGDTTLRPDIWREPRLMRKGRTKGFAIVAGSDPLPFKGEERRIGSYGIVFEGAFDEDRPVRSLRPMLRAAGGPSIVVGSRGKASEVWTRLKKNRRARKAGGSA